MFDVLIRLPVWPRSDFFLLHFIIILKDCWKVVFLKVEKVKNF